MERYDGLHARPNYPLDPDTAVMVGIDYQLAFGQMEPVPAAASAVANFIRAADAWRAVGGAVLHVRTYYREDTSAGRMADFAPWVMDDLAEDTPMTAMYDGVARPGEELLHKTRFSAVAGGDLLQRLAGRGATTVVVAGLTTPICVQTTVDALMMADYRVVLLDERMRLAAMGPISARDAHRVAVERMRYIMAQVLTTDELVHQLGRFATAQ